MTFRPCRRAVTAWLIIPAAAAAAVFHLFGIIWATLTAAAAAMLAAELLSLSYKLGYNHITFYSGVLCRRQKLLPFASVRSVSISTEPIGQLCGYRIITLFGPSRAARIYGLCCDEANTVYAEATQRLR